MLNEKNGAFRDYEILFYHVDQKHDLSISSLFDFLTEIALYHTLKAGYGFSYLEKNNFKWILYKIKLRVNRYPRLGEKVRVSTWGENIIKFNAYRKFELSCGSEKLAEAESIWLMVDSEKMRPVRIPDEMYDGYGIERGKTSRIEIETLENPSGVAQSKSFTVNYADLDYNQHATSARYADWALETIPWEVRVGYDLRELCVNYFRELKYADRFDSLCSAAGGTENSHLVFDHGVFTETDKPAALMRSVWQRR